MPQDGKEILVAMGMRNRNTKEMQTVRRWKASDKREMSKRRKGPKNGKRSVNKEKKSFECRTPRYG